MTGPPSNRTVFRRSKRWSRILALGFSAFVLVAASASLDDQLREASARHDLNAITSLLKQGANPNTETENGVTPLIIMAADGNIAAARLLLFAGARVNEDGNQGCTALTWAARNGFADMVRLLIQWGANLDHQDKGGLTPLMRAAWNGQREAAHILISKNARLDLRDAFGNTALIYAMGAGEAEIASMILQTYSIRDPADLDVATAEERVSAVPRTPCSAIPRAAGR